MVAKVLYIPIPCIKHEHNLSLHVKITIVIATCKHNKLVPSMSGISFYDWSNYFAYNTREIPSMKKVVFLYEWYSFNRKVLRCDAAQTLS